MNTLRALITALALAIFPLTTYAAGLTGKQVENFIGSLPAVESLADDLRAEGKQDALAISTTKVQDGEFMPYTHSIGVLKKDSVGDYKRLDKIADKNGFKSADEWAETGDAVMRAFIALQIEQSGQPMPKQLTELTPEIMAHIPPDALENFKQSMQLLAAAKSASQGDKDAVRPYMEKLQKILDEAQAKAAAQ